MGFFHAAGVLWGEARGSMIPVFGDFLGNTDSCSKDVWEVTFFLSSNSLVLLPLGVGLSACGHKDCVPGGHI